MSRQKIVDELDGFEFEDLMVDIFRKMGYQNVRQTTRTSDEGRDILMENITDGRRHGVVVECKHTDSVGRPVIQKLHSATATYEFTGPKRGIVVTTGQFTEQAEEYATKLWRQGDKYPVELIDGDDLREIGEQVGLDLYNGRIEILCGQTLPPIKPTGEVDTPLENIIQTISNISPSELPTPQKHCDLIPTVTIDATINATEQTSVGVIYNVFQHEQVVLDAAHPQPAEFAPPIQQLVTQNRNRAIPLGEVPFKSYFDSVNKRRYQQTETEYKNWAISHLQNKYTQTVSYVGNNNVRYTKTCTPNQNEIMVSSVQPVYVPLISYQVELGQYTYIFEYGSAAPEKCVARDDFHQCVHCGLSGQDHDYVYCSNCGSINCTSHIKTERLEEKPVCIGCAVTERFFFKRRYFYTEENREQFRENYREMPFHKKIQENLELVSAIALGLCLLFLIAGWNFGII